MTPAPDATSPASQVGMSEARNEALIERLEARERLIRMPGHRVIDGDPVNPDGLEAAKVIRDLEAENARLRSAPIPAVQSGAVAWDLKIVADTMAEMQRQIEQLTGARHSMYDPAVAIARNLAAPLSEPLPGGVGEAVAAAIDALREPGNKTSALLYNSGLRDAKEATLAILAALSGKEQR